MKMVLNKEKAQMINSPKSRCRIPSKLQVVRERQDPCLMGHYMLTWSMFPYNVICFYLEESLCGTYMSKHILYCQDLF